MGGSGERGECRAVAVAVAVALAVALYRIGFSHRCATCCQPRGLQRGPTHLSASGLCRNTASSSSGGREPMYGAAVKCRSPPRREPSSGGAIATSLTGRLWHGLQGAALLRRVHNLGEVAAMHARR